jgi:hypothetical protein
MRRITNMKTASVAALMLWTATTAPMAQETLNGARSAPVPGASADIQGDANLGRNGIDRNDDIRRTATGELRIAPQQMDAVRRYASQLQLERQDDVNFTISVGAAAPRQSGAKQLPTAISKVLNTSSPMSYLLFRDQLVLIDEKSQRIVAVIPGITKTSAK